MELVPKATVGRDGKRQIVLQPLFLRALAATYMSVQSMVMKARITTICSTAFLQFFYNDVGEHKYSNFDVTLIIVHPAINYTHNYIFCSIQYLKHIINSWTKFPYIFGNSVKLIASSCQIFKHGINSLQSISQQFYGTNIIMLI